MTRRDEGPSPGPRPGPAKVTGPGRPLRPRVHPPEAPAATPEDGAGLRTPEDRARPLTREN